jgi:hypothetical protein
MRRGRVSVGRLLRSLGLSDQVAHSRACVCAAADAIAGWTLAEQDAWIAAPIGPQAFQHAIGIVDATYVHIQRPKNTQQERRLYSTYKKHHAVFFLAIIDRTGRLQHAAGRERELADCRAHHLRLLSCSGRFRIVDGGNPPTGAAEASVLARVCPWLRSPLVLLADVAYTSDSRCLCPYKAPQLTIHAAGNAREALRRRLYNQQLSRVRKKVEHAFSRLKHTFRQLQAQWPMPLSRLPATFRAAALLTNWLHRTRGL